MTAHPGNGGTSSETTEAAPNRAFPRVPMPPRIREGDVAQMRVRVHVSEPRRSWLLRARARSRTTVQPRIAVQPPAAA